MQHNDDDDADQAGAAEVFLGLVRPKLVLYMDEAFLLATAGWLLLGGFAGGASLYAVVFFVLGIATAIVGWVCGRISPHLTAEVSEYLALRTHAGTFLLCDDAGSDAPWIEQWRK